MFRPIPIIVAGLVVAFVGFLASGHLFGAVVKLDPAVSYQAEFSILFNNQSIDGKTRHSPGSTRSEYEFDGLSVVSIDLWERNRTYLILPELRQYTSLGNQDRQRAVERLRGLVAKYASNVREVRREKHEGLNVTKYMMARNGVRFAFWVTDDGLLVRLKGESDKGGNDGEGFTVEYMLTNIEVGPQDPALFRLPTGYREVPTMKHFRR